MELKAITQAVTQNGNFENSARKLKKDTFNTLYRESVLEVGLDSGLHSSQFSDFPEIF